MLLAALPVHCAPLACVFTHTLCEKLPGPSLLQGRRYAWAAEDKPLTTLTRGGCKSCGLFEDRRIPFVDVRPCSALAQAPGCDACSFLLSTQQRS